MRFFLGYCVINGYRTTAQTGIQIITEFGAVRMVSSYFYTFSLSDYDSLVKSDINIFYQLNKSKYINIEIISIRYINVKSIISRANEISLRLFFYM